MLAGLLLTMTLSTKYGVDFSGDGPLHDHPEVITDTGSSWVRLNVNIGTNDQDFAQPLGAGVNVILTLVNRDPANIDATYGTPQQFTKAGFPYKTRSVYEQRIRDTLTPALPYIAAGRQVYVQCENEAGDVNLNPGSSFWRGTTDQYLTQLSALYEAVRGLSPSMRVVMTSFASDSLEVVINPSDSRYTAVTTRFARMLGEGQYDAADLHFYNCIDTIATKVQWVSSRLPAGRTWISTENGGPDYNCPGTPVPYSQNPALYEQLQAQQVPARLKACSDAGGSICLWFSLFDLRGESEVFAHMGLLDQTSAPPRQKAAYAAFLSFVQSQATTRRRAAKH